MSKPRVVITGIGVMSACGAGRKLLWESLLQQKTALRLHPFAGQSESHEQILAGIFSDFDPAMFVKQRKSLKLMSRDIQLAIAASTLALSDAGIQVEHIDSERFGTLVGAGIINNDLEEMTAGILKGFDEQGVFEMERFGKEGVKSFFPLWFLKYLPNMPACHVSMAHGLKGPSNTITTGFAAGLQAIGEAFHIIQRKDADKMLAGASDSRTNPIGWAQFQLTGLAKLDAESPLEFCPYDEKQKGISVSEAAAFLVLESLESAQSRNAKIIAEILGVGICSETGPKDKMNSKLRSMNMALEEADIVPGHIEAFWGSGTGIPEEDKAEVEAFQSLFGEKTSSVQFTSTTPVTGHSAHASGAIQAAAGALSIQKQVLPPLAHLEKAKAPYVNFVKYRAQTMNRKNILLHSSGWGGQNASLVLGVAS